MKDADQIYTVEDGQIIESGEHDEFLEAYGRYEQLYHAQ